MIKEYYVLIFFFFQAEDGIRDDLVTGVQTCALPILSLTPGQHLWKTCVSSLSEGYVQMTGYGCPRSEERRVGKECRSRWGRCHYRKIRREWNRHTIQASSLVERELIAGFYWINTHYQ